LFFGNGQAVEREAQESAQLIVRLGQSVRAGDLTPTLLHLPASVGERIVADDNGELLACAAKTLSMPSEIFQRTTRHVQRANMSDPLRTDPVTPSSSEHPDVERDAKIESLLLAGLDHYFASNFTQAIDVWTRALFLDRNHARARAYIERARSALGEQQRESEELIHNGVAAFERGEIEAARQLLNAAVQRGGAHEVALAFLTRIDRISAVPMPVASAPAVVASGVTIRSAARACQRAQRRSGRPRARSIRSLREPGGS